MRIFSAPMARKNLVRFSVTRARVSQSVKPRLRTRSGFDFAEWDAAGSSLAPPRRVLNPWTNQSNLASAGDSRICRPATRRGFHPRELPAHPADFFLMLFLAAASGIGLVLPVLRETNRSGSRRPVGGAIAWVSH